MDFGIQLGDFRFAERQFIQLRIDVHHRIEHRFRFQRKVYGVLLLTVGIQFVFSHVQLATHLRQLHFEELEAFRGFFRFARHVLRHVVVGDTVEDVADLIFVFTHHRERQHTGLFTILGDAQAILQVIDHPQC